MKNITLLALSVILIACRPSKDIIQVTTQETFSRSFEMDENKVYNLHTGEKIAPDKFLKMVEGKSFSIQPVIDEYGRRSKSLYDTTGAIQRFKIEGKMILGEKFPEFAITTVEMEQLRLSSLKGKIVVVRFELFADTYDFENDRLQRLENKMETLGKSNVEGVMFFLGMKEQLESLDTKGSQFHLFVQGANFHQRYGVTATPTTAVINREGILVGLYEFSEEIDLSQVE